MAQFNTLKENVLSLSIDVNSTRVTYGNLELVQEFMHLIERFKCVESVRIAWRGAVFCQS
jgi:hypothetical protein